MVFFKGKKFIGLFSLLVLTGLLVAAPPSAYSRNYTLDADFDEGTLVNINHDDVHDQLQLDSEGTPFNFIWVAVSSKGTVVKIDTETGAVLGEYRTAPNNFNTNPSRTTVDNNGNVWVANRDHSVLVLAEEIDYEVPLTKRFMGSVVHIGLKENGQCVDRNGNGIIDTSTGLGDIRNWDNAGGVDTLGDVSTADDECIIHHTLVNSTGTRHISVDINNDVWVSGLGGRYFDLLDGSTGAITRQEPSVGFGGYGGLIDGNDVIWSASPLLRWDTFNPLTGLNGDPAGSDIGPPISDRNWSGQGGDSYGLCIDFEGNVWNTQLYGNLINKYDPDGIHLGAFSHGSGSAQGCVVDGNGHVWVAHSLLGPSNTVGHLLNNGTYIGNVTVGSGPTGVAVDAAGKIWATNYYGQTVSRIDPALGPTGADGSTLIGDVDLTTVNLGGNLYNYSDMTGSTLIAPPNTGTWTIVHDSGVVDATWRYVFWTASEPGDSTITVTAASSTDGVTFGPPETVTDGVHLTVADGQYLKVVVSFSRSTSEESPVLYDLAIYRNHPPVADPNGPYLVALGSSVIFDGSGSSDPDGDPLIFTWDFGDGSPQLTDGGPTPSHTYAAAGTYVVCLTVNDGYHDSEEVCTTVHVNQPPVADPNGPYLVALGSPVVFDGSGSYDPDGDPLAYHWRFGDGNIAISQERPCHTYADANIYDVCLTVNDGYHDSDEVCTYAVIYDPSAGFVTGGGWIYSEPGAYVPDPTLEGKANFGFVSKYKKGAETPTGNTEFQFHAGDLNFHSDSYEWLVVTGSNYARFKGSGTINGMGEYKFMLWAGDDEPDTFRIKIWEEDEFDNETVTYDNGFDQAIASGSIVIHTKK